jgi:predicted transposase YdaD
LPYLWILTASASENLLNGFGAYPSENWGPGIYFLHHSLRVAIVALNQIPVTEETLLLRILGKGQTQKRAIDEVIAFDDRDPRRSAILKLITNWKISIEITGQVEEEQELMMVLSQAYLEWEQQTEQRGKLEGKLEGERSLIFRQITRRIGDVAPEVRLQIQSLSLSQLEALGEALLDFSELNDLMNWLQSHS